MAHSFPHIPVSILILTYNEEVNLPRCLGALGFSDDVLVFDSFSSDRTVQIAKSLGARVLQRRFDGYGQQREAARATGEFRHEWVLAVDADEIPDAELVAEIGALMRSQPTHDAFRMRRKDLMFGKWIRHSTMYPLWFLRLFRHQRVHYPPRSVHEYPEVDGTVGVLQGHLIHDVFSKGLSDWMSKHVQYAEREAKETVSSRGAASDVRGALQFGDAVRRRRALKQLSYRLPFRPLLKFLYMYGYRGGILDGREGFTYCRLIHSYEYLVDVNIRRLIADQALARRISSEEGGSRPTHR